MKHLIKQVFGPQLKSVGSRVQKYLIRYKECDNYLFYEYDKSFKKNFLIQNMQNKSTNFLGEFCFYLLQTLKENTLVNSNSDSGINNLPELGIKRSTKGEKGSTNFYGTVGTQKHYFSYMIFFVIMVSHIFTEPEITTFLFWMKVHCITFKKYVCYQYQFYTYLFRVAH